MEGQFREEGGGELRENNGRDARLDRIFCRLLYNGFIDPKA